MGLLLAYGAGVALVLLVADDRWPARLLVAVLWPASAAILSVVVACLVLALPLARPLTGSVLLLALALLGWLGWQTP